MKTFFIVLFGLAIISTEAAGGNYELKVKVERQLKGHCYYYNDDCYGTYKSKMTLASCCGSGGRSLKVHHSWSWSLTCMHCQQGDK